MFALDLFNNDHERRLAEGAVDQLEQRRIDDLAMKMDDLVARAKTATTAEVKQALMKEFQKCKAERDSYYKVREGTVTPTATGLRHHAKPENYGGYEPEADPLARLDKHAVNRADKAMGIKFDREKKYQGGLDLGMDEAGIPGNVPTEKIPGKEDLLKGKGRSYYEANQKKNSELDETRLAVGDPITVTAPNEFEGKTGEIYEFSPSGKFVIVDLYNHGRHSMHLSDIEYNEYADQEADEEDDWYDEELDESAVNPQFIIAQVTKILATEARRMTNAPIAQLLAPVMKEYGLTLQQIDSMVPGGLRKAAGEYGIMMKEGFQDFNKVEPYAVCLAGKPVKKFDYYEEARRFHDNWKQKLYREGNKEKADKITLMPLNLDEVVAAPPPEAPPAIIAPAPATKYMAQKPQAPKAQADVAPRHAKVSPYSDDESTLKIYKPEQYRDVNEAEDRVDPILIKALNNMPDGLATHHQVLDAAYDAYAMELGKMRMKSEYGTTHVYIPKLMGLYKDKHGLTFNEAANPAQQAAIAIAMKRAGNKPKQVDEDTGSWIVYDPETKQIKKRFKTHTAGKSYAKTHGLGFASSEYYFDRVKDNKEVAETSLDELSTEKLAKYKKAAGADASAADKRGNTERGNKRFKGIVKATIKQGDNDAKKHQGIAEAAMSNLHAELSDVYNRMAPGIERNRDSFKAGQLYDALEAVAEQHGAETEFKRMMAGARNRAHMDYDTNPGGFQNWFWYLPFDQEELSEEQDTSGVERAILNRIMVAHTDLLMKFGPDKVMQAAEEVAYNVGDVDEIGTSDVSAYVKQVQQILGA